MVKITMLLAQGPGKPDGDLEDKLQIRASLTANAQIDDSAQQADPNPWLAVRARPGHETRESELIRLDEGWALQSIRGDDDPLWTFNSHVIRPGEIVRLGRPDGEELLYRIVAVEAD